MLVVIGYLAAALTSTSALPQLVQTLRTREVRGISIPSWLALAAGVALWLVYGIGIHSGPLIVANAVALALDVAVVALAVRFRPASEMAAAAPKSQPWT